MRAVKTRCCHTVRYSNNLGSSEKKASCRFAAMVFCARSAPAMRAEPRVAGMMPDRQRKVVVLPAPFGPTNPRTSPGRTVNDKSLTAGNLSYSLVNPSTSIMASDNGGSWPDGPDSPCGQTTIGPAGRKAERRMAAFRTEPDQELQRPTQEADLRAKHTSAFLPRRLPRLRRFLHSPW